MKGDEIFWLEVENIEVFLELIVVITLVLGRICGRAIFARLCYGFILLARQTLC